MVDVASIEGALVTAATGAFVAAMVVAAVEDRRPLVLPLVLPLLLFGVALQTIALAGRWSALGHGPFTTLYEVLASSVWSLTLMFAVVYSAMPAMRPTAALVMPFVVLLCAWMLASDPSPGHLPPTFDTSLLYVHSVFGKLFLGALMIAVAISGAVLARRTVMGSRFAVMPSDERLTEVSYRFAAFAFIFDTVMLIVGAVWAQEAWGRYWAWDPLETWAFLTWLALAFGLHLKIWMRPPPLAWAVLVKTVFILAFLTFFGVPFVSESPHKGVF